ncbi:MAG: pyridoxine 5-phosphate synthase [bacterium P3]|nr:MAG: pyridoxine 5-phosphate synthase [bacterium P3]KWW42615.1 MAG: pyridoxine 5-phosphate synthase [bacterium F083]
MTKLSVNINKVATIRNARGGNTPDVLQFAVDCERFGAQGITVHPRPDERHIRYSDALALKPLLREEFNIEGNPKGRAQNPPYGFIDLVKEIRPAQVTLVPDAEGVLTSNAGWDTVSHQDYLCDVVKEFKRCGIRVSIFIDADARMIEMAAKTGTDRVELYTESYVSRYTADREAAVAPFVKAAAVAHECGLGLNAGHDLSLENLTFFHQQIPWLDEVSIGHALISDALYLGIEETIRRYRQCLG